jgi:hypothetical protein
VDAPSSESGWVVGQYSPWAGEQQRRPAKAAPNGISLNKSGNQLRQLDGTLKTDVHIV